MLKNLKYTKFEQNRRGALKYNRSYRYPILFPEPISFSEQNPNVSKTSQAENMQNKKRSVGNFPTSTTSRFTERSQTHSVGVLTSKLKKVNTMTSPSIFNKLGAWFLKDSGKQFVFGCATVGSIGLASAHIFSNVFFINQYRDLFQFCRNGFSVPIPQPLMQRVEKTMDILELNDNEKSLAKPFITVGFEIFSAGSFWSRFGTIIGLPINFTYIDTENVNPSSIRIREMSVEWELPEGKSLLKSLTLSEKAQMYAIAKQIELRRTLIFYYELFTILAVSTSAYAIGSSLNVKLNLFEKPRSVRFILYSLVGSFATMNYLLFKDFGHIYFEEKVDDYLVQKNVLFKEGGVEYYSSILNRNVALRKLMGKAGESKFTALGNENNLIRTTHSPLVQRKLFFEQNLQSS